MFSNSNNLNYDWVLRNNGYDFCKRWVCEALQGINSVASNERKVKIGRLLTPRDYRAEYFDHKIHYNQNKKLRIHTTVHVCARVLLYDLRVRNHGNKKLFNNKWLDLSTTFLTFSFTLIILLFFMLFFNCV